MPCCTEPSEASSLISERLGIPSTKYGPSVCCGVPWSLINDEGVSVSVHVLFVEALIWAADSSGDGGGNGGVRGGLEEDDNTLWLDDDIDVLLSLLGIDCAETANPGARTISPDKDNAMTIEGVLLFFIIIIVAVWFVLSSFGGIHILLLASMLFKCSKPRKWSCKDMRVL
jgi:hypothetical protein